MQRGFKLVFENRTERFCFVKLIVSSLNIRNEVSIVLMELFDILSYTNPMPIQRQTNKFERIKNK